MFDRGCTLAMNFGDLKPISENAQTPAQSITEAATVPHQPTYSPGIARTDTLVTEVMASLQQKPILERQPKSRTANTALRDKYTTDDLKQHPGKVSIDQD